MARKGDYTIRCVTAVLLGMGRTRKVLVTKVLFRMLRAPVK